MPLEPTKAPWYAATGLKFRCTACGACCTGAPGYVWLRGDDVRRLAEHRGMSVEDFARRYVRRVGDRLSLKERSNGDCVMLEDKKCSVYASKPTACSTFPFWDGVLETKATWAETAKSCPGMDHGDVYDAQEVDVLRRGVPEPLLSKQAAARARSRGEDGDDVPGVDSVPPETLDRALAELEAMYEELAAELPRYGFACQGSGDCCDFSKFSRRLYASTLEAEWFFRKAPPRRENQDPRLCPAWGSDRLCHARDARFLGCRTFFCGSYRTGDPDEVHERWHRRVKDLHARHGIPWRYADVLEWAKERRPARR